MTTESQVATFLEVQKPRAYCDDCTAKMLRLGSGSNRHMARNATAGLALGGRFTRAKGLCAKCGRTKLVTRAN